MDIQDTMPRGSPEDVREEVARRMSDGKVDGGFIICTAHNMQPDVPVRNIVALFEACEEFGRYG
jgi:uroporphyrinogen decarboxylase